MKRQNKLRTYLAVTAGVGCAGSVSNAAVVMIDVSAFSGPNGGVPTGELRGFGIDELEVAGLNVYNGVAGYYFGLVGFGSVQLGTGGGAPTLVGSNVLLGGLGAYSSNGADVLFRSFSGRIPAVDGFGFLPFRISSDGGDDAGVIGFFQVTFDGDDMFEILGGAFESVAGNPITTFDTTAVPEPSSLALLALGATGLAARRKRKMAA